LELLWEELTGHIWSPHCNHLLFFWRDEFNSLYRTAFNLSAGRYLHTQAYLPLNPNEYIRHYRNQIGCNRLTISDDYIDGKLSINIIVLFKLPACDSMSHIHVPLTSYWLELDNYLLIYPTFTGINIYYHKLIFSNVGWRYLRLFFTNDDGNLHLTAVRRTRAGNPKEDGTLADFTGDDSGGWAFCKGVRVDVESLEWIDRESSV